MMTPNMPSCLDKNSKANNIEAFFKKEVEKNKMRRNLWLTQLMI